MAQRGPFAVKDPARKCSGTNKKTGGPCGNWALVGLTVCRYHGGSTGASKAKSDRARLTRRLEQNAAAALAYEGIAPVADPLDELGKLANESRSLLTALGERVNALEDIESFSVKSGMQLRPVVEMYERAMDRTQRMLDSLVKHGYTERQVQIAESEATILLGVVVRVLATIGLTNEQQNEAKVLIAQELRSLEATPPTVRLGD